VDVATEKSLRYGLWIAAVAALVVAGVTVQVMRHAREVRWARTEALPGNFAPVRRGESERGLCAGGEGGEIDWG